MFLAVNLIDIFLHLNKYLDTVLQQYGTITYLFLFFIVFMETGFVVTPFLPGDSLIFAAGTLAAGGSLNVWMIFALLAVAAVLGDTVNYWIGHAVGPRAFTGKVRFLKKEYLDRTHAFYVKHGGKTIIIARFIPIIRTFAPFVAGVGTMNYRRFISYNVIGGVGWVALFAFGGYFFGSHPIVQKNYSIVIMAIIAISVLPMVIEFIRARLRRNVKPAAAPADK